MSFGLASKDCNCVNLPSNNVNLGSVIDQSMINRGETVFSIKVRRVKISNNFVPKFLLLF